MMIYLGCPRKRADLASQNAEFFCGVINIAGAVAEASLVYFTHTVLRFGLHSGFTQTVSQFEDQGNQRHNRFSKIRSSHPSKVIPPVKSDSTSALETR